MDKTEVIRLIKEWIKADTEINEIKKIEQETRQTGIIRAVEFSDENEQRLL
jgi:hypothetical protein